MLTIERIGIKSFDSEPIENNEDRKGVNISPILVFSPICFHFNRVGNGNDNISAEEDFENSKT